MKSKFIVRKIKTTFNFLLHDIFFCEIQTSNDDNLAALLITIIEVVYAFGVLLVSSELSHQNYQAFDDCHDVIQQFDWYLFPVEIQRLMPMIFNFTQEPVKVMCFGNIPCNRETFKYVSVD